MHFSCKQKGLNMKKGVPPMSYLNKCCKLLLIFLNKVHLNHVVNIFVCVASCMQFK